MKTMKKLQLFIVVAMLAVFATMAVGCGGDKVEEFKYSDVELSSNVQMDETMKSSLEQIYEALYSSYTLGVSDKEFILKSGSAESKMTYTKDGDKYVFQGEEAQKVIDAMNSSFATAGLTYDKVEFYGEKTDNGWNIVMEDGITAENQTVTMKVVIKFVK